MGKVGAQVKVTTRRQLWRDDSRIYMLASEPTSMILCSRPNRRCNKKSGGRRKTFRMSGVLSPSKIKKIRHAYEKKKTGGMKPGVSNGLK
jgi:hypothetical protein